jgi:hypothetical protein
MLGRFARGMIANAATAFAAHREVWFLPRSKGHPGGCRVCVHAERLRIELLLAGGAGQTAVGAKYSLSKDSIHRHWHAHVTDERRAALLLGPVQRMNLSAQVAEESDSVIDHHKAVRAGLYTLYEAAVTAGDRTGGALLSGKLTEVNNSIAKICGQLATSPLVLINNSQTTITALTDSTAFRAFQARLIAVLARHPEARDEVMREFERLDGAAAVSPAPAPLAALEHDHATA